MRITRTQARRELSQHGNGAHPSVLETLARNLSHRVVRSATLGMKQGVRGAVRWTALRLILGWLGIATLTGGLVMLFAGGVKGLEALHFPLWLALLSNGVLAVLVALVAMGRLLGPKECG